MTDWKIPTINGPYKLGSQNYFTYPLGGYNPTYRVYVTPPIAGFEAHRVDSKPGMVTCLSVTCVTFGSCSRLGEMVSDGFLGKMFEVSILEKPRKLGENLHINSMVQAIVA